MVIFMLAECAICGTRYAIAPALSDTAQWLLFERKSVLDRPSHLCTGAPLCAHGHALDITAEEAVLTAEGDWLVLTVSHPEPVLN